MRGRTFDILAAAIAALALGAGALAGCGSDDSETPEACLAGADVYLDALKAAPGAVSLDAETPISDCLPAGQSSAELATVGEAIVGAATKLNIEAQKDPAGDETVQLGYLVGAVQEGVTDTGGIHADLIRRLDAAARFSPTGLLPAEFERSFGEGYSAGQETG